MPENLQICGDCPLRSWCDEPLTAEDGEYRVSEEYGTVYDGSVAYVIGRDGEQIPLISEMSPRGSLAEDAVGKAELCTGPSEKKYTFGSFVVMRSVRCGAFPGIVGRSWFPARDTFHQETSSNTIAEA